MAPDASTVDQTPFLDRPPDARVLGPYRLVRKLGQGSFAPVWLADEVFEGTRPTKLREAAVKVFLLPPGVVRGSSQALAWRDGIVAEAQALCRVDHPNIARFYGLVRDDDAGAVGLAMEHVPGRSLADQLEAERRLPPERVAAAGAAIAWALSAVHHAGLCHRDVKPGNVIGNAAGYKLIDFGIGVDVGQEAARGVAGTAGYIAPECTTHGAPPSPSVDLYALGATLYRLRTGTAPPWRLDVVPASHAPFPAPLFDIVRKLLDPNPRTRPCHAEWVARELERACAAITTETAPPAPARG